MFLELLKPFEHGQPDHGKKVIVFSNMKANVAWIHKHCAKNGFQADSISGGRSQSQRESTLRKFRAGSVSILIATDVAARGLDIPGVYRVINYDFPLEFPGALLKLMATFCQNCRNFQANLFLVIPHLICRLHSQDWSDGPRGRRGFV